MISSRLQLFIETLAVGIIYVVLWHIVHNFAPFSGNNDIRLSGRRREFDVDELRRLAAQSVGRSSQDIDTFVKLAEGGFNQTFLITMHDGFEMEARIPYPVTVPKLYAIASEVATMRFLLSSVPLGCLFLKFTITHLRRTMLQRRSIFSWNL